MMRKSVLAAGIAALCLATSASAQNYLDFRIPFADPFPYKIDGRVDPVAGLSLNGAVVPATKAAWQAWDNVPGAFVQFSYQGLSTTAPSTDDTVSVSAIFVTDPSDPYYNFALAGGASVSATVPLTYAGAVYACDIFLNAFDYAWSTGTPTPAGAFDVQTVMMHEIGHCLGLGDSYSNVVDVMFAQVQSGAQKRSLSASDVNQLNQAYPAGGYGAPCPGGQTNCTGGGLTCIHPDGGASSPYCSIGCAVPPAGSTNNPCGMPYLCKTPVLIPGNGITGTCLPSAGQETVVGRACTSSSQCGSVNGICIPSTQLPSGAPAWYGGYCSQDCNPNTGTPCPSGSSCYNVDGQGTYRCLKQCQPGSNQCRQNYSCSPLAGLDAGVGACVSACVGDVDCGANQICRTCDGICEFKQTSTTQVGDPCTNGSTCGVGQVCLKFPWNTLGVCSQPCSTGCAVCPQGSTCRAVGANNAGYCLKDCQDGTCAAGEQCGYTGTGRGCMPACQSSLDCPTNFVCSAGQCVSTSPTDAGTCALCYVAGGDGGLPSGNGNGGDGGTGPVTPGGCGCQGTGGPAAFFLLVLVALTFAGARRTWPTR